MVSLSPFGPHNAALSLLQGGLRHIHTHAYVQASHRPITRIPQCKHLCKCKAHTHTTLHVLSHSLVTNTRCPMFSHSDKCRQVSLISTRALTSHLCTDTHSQVSADAHSQVSSAQTLTHRSPLHKQTHKTHTHTHTHTHSQVSYTNTLMSHKLPLLRVKTHTHAHRRTERRMNVIGSGPRGPGGAG